MGKESPRKQIKSLSSFSGQWVKSQGWKRGKKKGRNELEEFEKVEDVGLTS